MACKLNNPPNVANAAVHEIGKEGGVLGKGERNGNIVGHTNINDDKARKTGVENEEMQSTDRKYELL